MNIVDALVVSIGFDTSGLKKGASDATAIATKVSADMVAVADKGEKGQTTALGTVVRGWNVLAATQRKAADVSVTASKTMAGATERVVDSGEKAIRTFGALFLLFAGAGSLKNFASSMISLDATVGRLAHNTGTTTQVISGLARASERMGGSVEGAAGGLGKLSDAYQDLRLTGNNAIMEPLAKLQGLSGKAITFGKDVHENFLSIADALKVVEDRGETALADRLGHQILGDEGLTNLAKKGRAGVLADEAASPKVTEQQAKAAQDLQAQLTAVRQGFQEIGNSILMDFGPAMINGLRWVKDLIDANKDLIETKVKEWIKDVADWFRDHKSDIDDFGGAMKDLVGIAGTLAKAFMSQSPMMQAMEAFGVLMGGTVLKAVTGVLGVMRSLGALPVPAALGALAAAFGAKYLGDNTANPLGGGRDMSWGEGAMRFLDPGAADRMYGKSGEQHVHGPHHGLGVHAAPKDDRTLWQRRPTWLGGTEAPKAGANPEVAAYIAQAAAKRGIDPRVALGVAGTEGLNGYDLSKPDRGGDKGTSFGPFQLHYKSNVPGFRNAGMGDDFTRQTGKDARDPSTWRDQVDFAMDHAAKHGWQNWHGWKGAPNAGLGMDPAEAAKLIPGRPAPVATAPAADDKTGLVSGDLSSRATYNHGALDSTKGLIFHHTGGRSSPEGVVDTLNQRGLGVQYVMDRDGKITRTLPEGARGAHILRSEINGLNNGNTQGVEVIAKDDKDVTPAQVAAGRAFAEAMAKRYPGLQVFGHGEVNPSHKQADEGRSIVEAYRAEAGKPVVDRNFKPAPIPVAQRTLQGYMGRDDVAVPKLEPARQKLADAMNAPPSLTAGDAIRHVLGAISHARKLMQHADNHPVAVELTSHSATQLGERTFGKYIGWGKRHPDQLDHSRAELHRHAASYGRMMKVADAGRYAASTTHNVDHSITSDTTVNGGIHVHTAATDARGIAADIEPHLRRGQKAGRADYGLA